MALAELAVFVRPPVRGAVKTRLVPLLGEEGASVLYRAFVEDTLERCVRIRDLGRVAIALWVDGPPDAHLAAWSRRLDASLHTQADGDLGARMAAAFDHGLSRYERVVLVGTDTPTLPLARLAEAFDALGRRELVLGPANDGGYYAIGARRPVSPRFTGVRWSTPHALADTLAANPGRRLGLLSPWYDVDEPSDVAILRAHLSVRPGSAPATARAIAELAQR